MKIKNADLLPIVTNKGFEMAPLLKSFNELGQNPDLPISFSWDFITLLSEVHNLANRVNVSRNDIITKYGTKIEGQIIIPPHGHKDFDVSKLKAFEVDMEELSKIDTPLKSKKPVLKRSELSKNSTKIAPLLLVSLKDFIVLQD